VGMGVSVSMGVRRCGRRPVAEATGESRVGTGAQVESVELMNLRESESESERVWE
jgi:hypothetical protein